MPVAQKFVFEFPEGVEPLDVNQWVEKNCTAAEQAEFAESRARQEAIRAKAIDSGRMTIAENDEAPHDYVWATAEEAEKNKENDPVWTSYWHRYEEATGVKFTIVTEEV